MRLPRPVTRLLHFLLHKVSAFCSNLAPNWLLCPRLLQTNSAVLVVVVAAAPSHASSHHITLRNTCVATRGREGEVTTSSSDCRKRAQVIQLLAARSIDGTGLDVSYCTDCNSFLCFSASPARPLARPLEHWQLKKEEGESITTCTQQTVTPPPPPSYRSSSGALADEL